MTALKSVTALATAAMLASPALAEGELNIFNWGNYTSPDLIEKFEKEYDIDVTITDYDSNDTALAKVRAGGHGFDIVVPSATYIPIWISEGLLLESRPDEMENFKNVAKRWAEVDFDPGRRYTVPWQWGTVGLTVNTSIYDGDINTSAIFLGPVAFGLLLDVGDNYTWLFVAAVVLWALSLLSAVLVKPLNVAVER